MVTATFAPLDLDFAADAEGSMRDALNTAEDAMRELVAARRDKRATQMALDDREAELTMQVISQGSAVKSNAETRKAEINLAVSRDPLMQSGRLALADAQNRLETFEYQGEVALKRYAAAHAVLNYATSVVQLYAGGRELT